MKSFKFTTTTKPKVKKYAACINGKALMFFEWNPSINLKKLESEGYTLVRAL